MPSFLQISTSRSAQDTKAPSAHTVTICQIPPSCSGANDSPYEASGGLTLICQMFQVGPSAALHRIIAIPTSAKNIVVIPKKPTKNGPTQKSNRSPPMSVPPRTRYFLSKLSIAIVRSSACEIQRRSFRLSPGSYRKRTKPAALSDLVRSGTQIVMPSGRHAWWCVRQSDLSRLCLAGTVQPVEPVGREQDEVDHDRQSEQEREEHDQRTPRIEQKPNSPHVSLSLCQHREGDIGEVLDAVQRRLVASGAGQPGTPHPGEDVSNHRDSREE